MEKTSPDSATFTPQQLAEMATHPEWEVRLDAAQHPSTSAEALSWLAGDNSVMVRLAVAKNPSTPPEILSRLAEDQNKLVRAGVGRNPSTPPEVLSRLADDQNDSVRAAVGRNPSTPPVVLSRLAGDESEAVRYGVAGNPSTPPEILSRLAEDRSVFVRRKAAANPSTPPEVRYQPAEDPATPRPLAAGEGAQLTPLQAREVLELASERGCDPRSCLPQSYSVLAEIEAEGVRPLFHQRLEAARAASLEEHLSALAQDPSPAVRQILAARPDLPQEMQAILAQDPKVAYTIAERPDLTPEAARTAFQTGGCALSLAQNPACPEELLQGLYEQNPQTAWAILQNPAAPSELLHQMALRESDAWLLYDLARHPHASLSTSAEPSLAQEARAILLERLERGLECER